MSIGDKTLAEVSSYSSTCAKASVDKKASADKYHFRKVSLHLAQSTQFTTLLSMDARQKNSFILFC
ncbi:MAG: hypothetical protein IIB44_11420 [Candidatus Marinimicrobia bacterium]|nr:hypothetical protein [Candidatus Neomarinimicrobiota bacterium]